jgi:hypothetical protein
VALRDSFLETANRDRILRAQTIPQHSRLPRTRILATFACLTLLPLSTNHAPAADPDCPPPPGAVSLWAGEGDGNDRFLSNHGVVGGLSFKPGKVGQCFEFSGASNHLFIQNSTSLDVGAGAGFTIEGWVNPADATTQFPVAEYNDGATLGLHFWLSVEWAGFGGPGSLYAALSTSPDHIVASPPGVVRASEWQHIALTYDRATGTGRVYHNGVEVGSRVIGDAIPITFFPLYLGYRVGGDSYRGLLDEMTIYNRALPPEELRAIVQADSKGKCPQPPPKPLAQPAEFLWRNPLPMANLLNRAAYGNGQFVAVGGPGQIFTSLDGAAWTQQASGTSNGLTTIAFSRGQFVAAGEHGTILSSSDATNWLPRASGTTQTLRGSTYGHDIFVLVGDAGTILTSADASQWTHATTTTIRTLASVAADDELFVAVGDAGTILTSPDGNTWTPRESATVRWLNDVAFGNRNFVALGFDGTLLTSPDGIQWTPRHAAGVERLFGVTFGGGQFTAVGGLGKILTSSDGQAWTVQASGTNEQLYSVAFGAGRFIALGGEFATLVLTSPDARTWTRRSRGDTRTLYDVTYANNTFVAVGARGAILSSSSDGTWHTRSSGVAATLRNVAFGNGLFVAVGQRETILTSPDGVVWTPRFLVRPKPPPGQSVFSDAFDLTCVCYGAGQFVVLTTGETALLSSDGSTWNAFSSPPLGEDPEAKPRNVAFGNATYRAVGFKYASGRLVGWSWESADGKTWRRGSGGGYDVTFANGLFVSAGTAVAYGNGTFAALNSEHSTLRPLIFSASAANLLSPSSSLRHRPNTTRKLYALAYGNGSFVAVGDNGTILQSPAEP